VSKPDDEDQRLLYQVVAARRIQWDNLIWQVPLLSLTAQAFLFSIALGSDARPVSRIVASGLSMVVSVLCILLMARHRQADVADAAWLERWEKSHSGGDPERVIHGEPWRIRRNAARPELGLFGRIPLLPGYRTWIVGLLVFFVVAAAIFVVSFVWPAELTRLLSQP
jgi:hypothetical protein